MTQCSVQKYIVPLLCYLAALQLHCRSQPPPEQGVLHVIVTIAPLAEFVEQVGGDRVSVSVMVPSGASPHTYEPTPSQMTKFSTAHLYVKVGTPIEFELAWLEKLLALNNKIATCNASDSITLLSTDDHHAHEHSNGVDPHTWLSLRNAQTIVRTISRALTSLDPDHAAQYRTNAIQYCAQLDSLDSLTAYLFRDKTNRVFIAYHSVWKYFAHDYQLIPITIEANGKEPSARHIQEIITIARTHNSHVVFASPQFDPRYAEEVAKAINGRVILINPLAKDYISTLSEIAHTLALHME